MYSPDIHRSHHCPSHAQAPPTPPDFENPTDNGTDNSYAVEVTVTDSGDQSTNQPITVTDVNEPPSVALTNPTNALPEDTTAPVKVADIDDPQHLIGQVAISPDGTLSIIPRVGQGSATVEVRVQDDGGTANGGVDIASTTFTLQFDTAIAIPTLQGGALLLLAGLVIALGQCYRRSLDRS